MRTLIAMLFAGCMALAATEKPNFVVILADDLGAGELACYGNKTHKTLNLDALAREGMRFRTCYATPVCSPSRVLLLTGRYGFRTGWFNFTGRWGSPTYSNPGYDLGKSETTFAHLLKKAGYVTGLAGRWLEYGHEHIYIPNAGFDEYFIWAIHGDKLPPGVTHTGAWQNREKNTTSRYWHPCLIRDGHYVPTQPDDYGPDLINEFCLDFLRRHRNRPFLLLYPMVLVHSPYQPVPDRANRGQKKPGNLQTYVEYMDHLVGRLLRELDALGLSKNTVVIFAGDNGTEGAGKNTATERGARVPFIVRAPGLVKARAVSDELTDFSDVLPTLAELAGAPLPKDVTFDGRSLVPTFRGEPGTHREWIFSYLRHLRVLRDKRWLLEGDGKFYDCGANRDGNYKDVTDSTDTEVVAARKRFDEILQKLPAGPPPPVGKETASSASRPNILLVTADDLGCLLSYYGEQRIQTPRLDALAAAGVRFANAYVAESSCSQSRAALLTGLWPHQSGQIGLSHLGFTMRSGLPNLPSLLKAAGYRTGILGKLHVEPASDFPFDWSDTNAGKTRNVRWVASRSREFFASAKASGQPFFFYVNYFDPHVPLNKSTDQIAGLPEKPLAAADIREPIPLGARDAAGDRAATAHLLNAVLRLDAGVGLLLDELQAAGFADNTIVVFVGDNGTAMPRGKTWCYERGVRVPMIVRWPGEAKAGQTREETVSLLDLMPTLLAAAGVKAPDTLVGTALQPLLRGESGKDWREFLFTEMNFHEPQMFRGQRSVRDARYKLLLNLVPTDYGSCAKERFDLADGGVNLGSLTLGKLPPVELFDLQADPDETHNLADDPAHAATRLRLETALQRWREKRADPLLDPARLQRWRDARARWEKSLVGGGAVRGVVHIPKDELDLLK